MNKIIAYTAPIWVSFVALAVILSVYFASGTELTSDVREGAAFASLCFGMFLGGLAAVSRL